jgi:hypothetical protein
MRVTGWRVAAAAAALMIVPTAVVHAQRIGVVAGATFSQLRGIENVKAKNRQGTMFGATLRLPLGAAMAIQPELLFVNKGSELELGTGETKNLRLDYFELPVLLRFEGGQGSAFGPHFYAGPSIGYNLDCKVSSSGVTNTSSGLQARRLPQAGQAGVERHRRCRRGSLRGWTGSDRRRALRRGPEQHLQRRFGRLRVARAQRHAHRVRRRPVRQTLVGDEGSSRRAQRPVRGAHRCHRC